MSPHYSKTISRALITAGLLLIFISCHRYFMPVRQDTGTPANTGSFITTNSVQKYFILRKGENSYSLHDIIVDQQAMTLRGRLGTVPPAHRLYLEAKRNSLIYKEDEGGAVLNEVHIYIQENVSIDTAAIVTLPLDKIVKIEVIQHDRKRTTSSYVLGGLGIGLGVMVLAGVVIALTKSSCPFISVYDGQQYNLQGELFGGAVNAKLERTDYVPLRAAPVNGRYELRISNELRERQYTNFADLLLVEHADNVQIIPGEDGSIYSISAPVKPVQATLNNRETVLAQVIQKDEVFCHFNDSNNTNGINELNLTFPVQGRPSAVKLLLQLKNSYWFDYLYGEFTRKFGSSYASWQEQQKKRPAAEMIRWTEDQEIPMRVSLLTNNGWKEITRIKTVGPLAQRTLVIPVDASDFAGETIQVRLSTGFMFWELDEAALDFSANTTYSITRICPATAIDENGRSVVNELRGNDDLYLTQPEPGNYATITYNWNKVPAAGHLYTVILHTRGYYEPIREYSGQPMTEELKKFREPGALARFSLDRYQRIPKEHTLIALDTQ